MPEKSLQPERCCSALSASPTFHPKPRKLEIQFFAISARLRLRAFSAKIIATPHNLIRAARKSAMASRTLDEIDGKILAVLQEDGPIADVDLADKVHLSSSPGLARVKALERDGFIGRYVALLNPATVGLGVNIVVQVRLERQIESSLNVFEKAV